MLTQLQNCSRSLNKYRLAVCTKCLQYFKYILEQSCTRQSLDVRLAYSALIPWKYVSHLILLMMDSSFSASYIWLCNGVHNFTLWSIPKCKCLCIILSRVILYAIKMIQVKKHSLINVMGPQILAKGMTHWWIFCIHLVVKPRHKDWFGRIRARGNLCCFYCSMRKSGHEDASARETCKEKSPRSLDQAL